MEQVSLEICKCATVFAEMITIKLQVKEMICGRI